jgi:hypothetical protein
VPPKAFYSRVYDASPEIHAKMTKEEYYTWAWRFYYPFQLSPGWLKTEENLFKDMSEEQYRLLAPKLAYAGQLMSAEWAKPNEIRRVHTNMLALWGRVLKKALGLGILDATIDRLLADVHQLLRGEMEAKAVTAERYKDVLEAKTAGNGDK